jgi:NNP family nitrate/nitrite transporter-like MFS transporter
MEFRNKATRIRLFDLRTPQMRAFHMTWIAFFFCFFAWFGISPLMPIVRKEFQLTPNQIGWCIIAASASTIFARLLIGWLCDRVGPRLAYTWLLVLGSLGVMGIGLSHDYASFLFFRLLIGAIGASFVITQYHTSIMFASNCVGTANATTAGWGNLGGGATNMLMPTVFALLVGPLALSPQIGWRLAMFVAGLLCLLTGIAYCLLTQDAPEGNFADLRAAGKLPAAKKSKGAFLAACKDYRVWALAVAYGACFGIEVTINNMAALYFTDYFKLGLFWAGMTAGLLGMLNLFARALGGIFGDRCGGKWGLRGRVVWLFCVLFAEGVSLMLFSQMKVLALAIPAFLLFGLFVDMSSGATYSVVPFVNRKALGVVSGIVGAGGNAGAVAAGFLFKSALDWPSALLIIGGCVTLTSLLVLSIRFATQVEKQFEAEPGTFAADGAGWSGPVGVAGSQPAAALVD